jgi:fatty acid desaturase
VLEGGVAVEGGVGLVKKFLKDPKTRVRIAWVTLIVALVNWPLSQFTWASAEPPNILALSWLAIIFTCWDIIATADVRKEQDENGS